MITQLLKTDSSGTTIIIRIMVGAVFLAEGIQKFLYPAMRGEGRFDKMGFPNPEFFASFVGVFEILCGALLLVGFLTRGAAFAMLINMTVAIVVTKIPLHWVKVLGRLYCESLKPMASGVWPTRCERILQCGLVRCF
jgi:putative oxidoreductase